MTALSLQQLEFFNREGYLMVPDVFAPVDLMPLRDELTGVIDREAKRLVEEGRLSRSFAE